MRTKLQAAQLATGSRVSTTVILNGKKSRRPLRFDPGQDRRHFVLPASTDSFLKLIFPNHYRQKPLRPKSVEVYLL
jgi:glutamate 5-kinase